METTSLAPNMAVTLMFCLKSLSVRVALVFPSLHLRNSYPSAGTAVTETLLLAFRSLKLRLVLPFSSPLVRVPPTFLSTLYWAV